MLSNAVAYVLGILSFVPPFSGLLRFYLGNYVTGTAYTLSMGLCWIGNILDIVQIPSLVKRANRRIKQREMRDLRALEQPGEREIEPVATASGAPPLERIILRSAKGNHGLTTVSEVALEGGVSMEEARRALDQLVSQGFAEIRVSKLGVVAYSFPDLLGASGLEDFEEL